MSRKILVIGGGERLRVPPRLMALEMACWVPKFKQCPPFWSADYRNKRGKR